MRTNTHTARVDRRGTGRNQAVLIGWLLASTHATAQQQPPAPAPEALAYLENVLDQIEAGSIKKDADWPALRQQALEQANRAQTTAETYPAIRTVLEQLGDHHSALLDPATVQQRTAGRIGKSMGLLAIHPEAIVVDVFADSPAERAGVRVGDEILAIDGTKTAGMTREEFLGKLAGRQTSADTSRSAKMTLKFGVAAPRVVDVAIGETSAIALPLSKLLHGDIGYLEVPSLAAGGPMQERYAGMLQQMIAKLDQAQSLRGWIVDLRRNTGGNMWPMLAGLGPLLGEGKLGGFVGSSGTADWSYEAGKVLNATFPVTAVESPYVLKKAMPPVAVLIGRLTASSGEAVAIAFRGRDKTRFFGEPTRGLATANATHALSDGAMLVLTVALEADRLGQVYEGAIAPDETAASNWAALGTEAEPVIAAAIAWLRGPG